MQQQPETPEHKLRRYIVDVLQRMPQNDIIKPYIHDLLRQALLVIQNDNEENALICMHIFSDVFRTHKPQDPESAVQFLEFVKRVGSFCGSMLLLPQVPYKAWHAILLQLCTAVWLPDQILTCLATCVQLYKEFAGTYKQWFECLLPRSNQKLVSGHHPSKRSFKIVAECPVIGTSLIMPTNNSLRTNLHEVLGTLAGSVEPVYLPEVCLAFPVGCAYYA